MNQLCLEGRPLNPSVPNISGINPKQLSSDVAVNVEEVICCYSLFSITTHEIYLSLGFTAIRGG